MYFSDKRSDGVACFAPLPTSQHGYLMTPPSRSSAWRNGYDTPPNYTDHELNCGGFNHQWNTNGGKCGECGDRWELDVSQGERPNQAGGTYATGTITGSYTAGEVIDVVVKVTANHKGWFEFRLCAVNDFTNPVTWSCLNETLLELEDGSTRHYIIHEPADITTRLRLPADITCSQCVLQWLWHCGNNYGFFPNGTECVGCGPQEQFYGCADIEITNGDGSTNPPTEPPTGDVTTLSPPTTTTTATATTTAPPSETTTTGPPHEGDFQCDFVSDDNPDMDAWCNVNCNYDPCYCPSDCVCTPHRPC